jgi:tetratricopeptide (TPR) repeat protein
MKSRLLAWRAIRIIAAQVTTMKNITMCALALACAPAVAFAQNPAQTQKLFEAGRYQQVVEATTPEAPPAALYTAAQSQQKLGADPQAVEIYARLAERAEEDPWRFIGESGRSLIEGRLDAATEAAQHAVAIAGDLPEAHFQLGLVLAKREAWQMAADEFDAAANLNPTNAYAHYYGGLMHYRANRPDRMAIHFEQFLKLAPDAPERPEVLQIMRTVRGR